MKALYVERSPFLSSFYKLLVTCFLATPLKSSKYKLHRRTPRGWGVRHLNEASTFLSYSRPVDLAPKFSARKYGPRKGNNTLLVITVYQLCYNSSPHRPQDKTPPALPALKEVPIAMLMKKGEHWRCVNPFCGGHVTLQAAYHSREDPPRCPCGSPLKLDHAPRTFNYLDFLRPAAPELPREPKGKK